MLITLKQGFIGRDAQDGIIHIMHRIYIPAEIVGSANIINPPVCIFYGSKAVAEEDFTVKTYFESAGNKVQEWKTHEDGDGRYIQNNYKKGEHIIFAH